MIRDARDDDCATLSSLAFVSKAHWGYDDAFMAACRAELTVMPRDLARARVRVAVEDDGYIAGFHGVEAGELEWLFVAPAAMGRGHGAALYADACAIARDAGLRELRIESDPFAAPFYEHQGARRIGETPSQSIPGRVLPLFVADLSLRS